MIILLLFTFVASTLCAPSNNSSEIGNSSIYENFASSVSTSNSIESLDSHTTLPYLESVPTVAAIQSSVPSIPITTISCSPEQISNTVASPNPNELEIPTAHVAEISTQEKIVEPLPDDESSNQQETIPADQPLLIPPAPALPVLQELPVLVISSTSAPVAGSTEDENSVPGTLLTSTATPLIQSTSYSPQEHYGQAIQIPLGFWMAKKI